MAKKTDKKTDRKQIKFKGIEFEEVSEDEYDKYKHVTGGLDKDRGMLKVNGIWCFIMPKKKQKKCSKCGHVLKAVEE